MEETYDFSAENVKLVNVTLTITDGDEKTSEESVVLVAYCLENKWYIEQMVVESDEDNEPSEETEPTEETTTATPTTTKATAKTTAKPKSKT